MPSRRIADDLDEVIALETAGGWVVESYHHDLSAGCAWPPNWGRGCGMRFLDIPIAKDTTILDAFLTFRCFGSSDQDSVKSWIVGESNATPAQFSDQADYFGRDRTIAKVDWSDIEHWLAPQQYKSPSFPSVIQEIVNLAGWSSGKNLVLFWHDHDDRSDHDFNTRRMAISHFHDPSKAPVLHIFTLEDGALESYTTGGDSLQDLGGAYYCGQTFIPQTTHILRHIDINLRSIHPTRAPTVWLYLAGGDHKPTGDYLSKTYRSYSDNWNIYNVFRMRADMQPVEVVAGTEYVIVIHSFALDLSWQQQWQYDKDDATYPRGNRLLSTNYGATWSHKLNDDHIFAEFGTPPVPPPPPPPPVYHWAILDIEQIVTATGYKIIVTTNVPCHLFMYWTNQEPEKHDRTTVRRGLTIPAASQYCFVVWEQNEQHEPGDTITHTFIKEPWPVCETRWFTFRATTDDDWSPSVGPIFKKHRHAPPPEPPPTIFYPDPDPEVTSVDGGVANLTMFQTFAQSRAGPGTHAWPTAVVYMCRLRVSGARAPANWYEFARFITLFDLSPGLGLTIASASFHFWGISKTQSFGIKPALNLFTSNPASNTDLIPADYNTLGTTPLGTKLTYDDFLAAGWNEIPLNAAGIAHINTALAADGIVKLGLREADYDAPNIDPFPGLRSRLIDLMWEWVEHPAAHKPYLEVVWT